MSFLRDFGGALASNIGNEMKQREEEERRLKLEDELERRRFARRHNMEAKVALPEESPYGLPVQRGPGNWEQPTRIARRALLDEATGDVIEPARWDEGPSIPVPAPVRKFKESKRVEGNDLVTYRVYEDDGSEEEIARGARSTGGRSGGSAVPRDADGMTKKEREFLQLAKDREARLKAGTGKGGERPDNVRKAWDEEAARTAELEGEALRSKAMQYGMDQRGLPTDDDSLRSALLAQIDAQYSKRLEAASNRKSASEPASNDDGMSLDEALAYARKKAGGKLSPDVERRIRAAYGAN